MPINSERHIRRLLNVKSIEKLGSLYVKIDLEKDSEFPPSKPGQYVMAMTRDSEEIPLSVFNHINGEISLLIKKVGYSSSKFFELNEGDKILIRGPYGNSFKTFNHRNILMVSGGSGLAPLHFLACKRRKLNLNQDILLGFKSLSETININSFKNHFKRIIYFTDNGSHGEKGVPTDKLGAFIETKRYSLVVASGPEEMLYKTWKICREKKINAQFSLERHIKCSLGLCGSCIIEGNGKAYRICVEGPVFSVKDLEGLEDFGKLKFDETGRKSPIT